MSNRLAAPIIVATVCSESVSCISFLLERTHIQACLEHCSSAVHCECQPAEEACPRPCAYSVSWTGTSLQNSLLWHTAQLSALDLLWHPHEPRFFQQQLFEVHQMKLICDLECFLHVVPLSFGAVLFLVASSSLKGDVHFLGFKLECGKTRDRHSLNHVLHHDVTHHNEAGRILVYTTLNSQVNSTLKITVESSNTLLFDSYVYSYNNCMSQRVDTVARYPPLMPEYSG